MGEDKLNKLKDKLINYSPLYLFGVVFLISLGVLLIFSYLGLADFLKGACYFWPIMLIVLGLVLLFRKSRYFFVFSILNGVLLAIFVASAILNVPFPFFPLPSGRSNKSSDNQNVFKWFWNINKNEESKTDKLQTDAQKIGNQRSVPEKAVLVFKSEGGNIVIKGHTNHLTEYSFECSFGEYDFLESEKGGISTVDISFRKKRAPWKILNETHNFDMKLNKDVIWRMNYELSQISLDVDLGYYKVEEFKALVRNLSNIKIRLNQHTAQKELFVNLEVFGSSVRIDLELESSLRNEIGVELKLDQTISTSEFDEEKFTKNQKNLYQSKNFQNANKKIYINAKLNASRFELVY